MIAGYEDFREIYRGARFAVFRARPVQGSGAVVVKTVQGGRPPPAAVARLRGEHDVLTRLRAAGIVKPIALESAGGVPALVLEDVGMQTLAQRLDGRPLSVPLFLSFAIELTEAVAAIHACNVVHADLNPANVVIGEARQLTIIDFDSAVAVAGQAMIEGWEAGSNLLYVAPEQTGRMNRPLDRATDLYALGAIFYAMLTGGPPFSFTDPVELVHAHLARTPAPPATTNPAVPDVLSDLVMKLLAKMPERRYRSAEVLAGDLRQVAASLAAAGEVASFELGDPDASGRDAGPPRPERLHGRDSELDALAAAWRSARAGAREVRVVRGPAGVGKSALAAELSRRVGADGGWSLSGKCDLRLGNTPYGPLIEAFRAQVRALLEQPPEVVALWRQRIGEALGSNGRLLTELIPELERIVGEQPPLVAVGAFEAENRFRLVLTSFVRLLARPAHPLLFVLDDLQWADSASLAALQALATAPELGHLLLLVTYRSEEVPAGHPSRRTLRTLTAPEDASRTLELEPLSVEAVVALCGDALRCPPGRARPLAQLIRCKTAGNPFFIEGLLRLLHQRGLLVFDGAAAAWIWNLAEIEKVGLRDNVVELLLRLLGDLPAETQELLGLAACFGRCCTLDRIAALAERPLAASGEALQIAVRAGLLVSGEAGTSFTFVHDRIQQQAYLLIDEPRRQQIHRRIGERLRDSAPLFEVVDQLNLGAGALEGPADRLALAGLNLQAAHQAKRSSAFGPSLQYLQGGLRLLPDDAWQTCPELAFPLHREAIECGYLTGEVGLADELFEKAVAQAPGRQEKADLCGLRAVACISRFDHAEGVQWGFEGLRSFGIELAGVDAQALVAAEFAAVRDNLGERSPDALLAAPRMRDPEQLACMQLLGKLMVAAYVGRPDIAPFLIARMVNLSILHGNAVDSAVAYVGYAGWLQRMTGDHLTAHAFGKLGTALGAQLGDPVAQCRAVAGYGAQLASWLAPLLDQIPLLREAGRRGVEAGELQYGTSCTTTVVALLFHQGTPLPQILEEIEAGLALARQTRTDNAAHELRVYRQAIRCLAGLTRGRHSFGDADFDEERHLAQVGRSPLHVGLFQIRKLQVAYLAGDLAGASSLGSSSRPLLAYCRTSVLEVEHNFFTSLTMVGCAETAGPSERGQLLRAIRGQQRQLATWASNCPDNYEHKQLLIEAELARLEGRSHEAEALYDRAIEVAIRQRFVQDEALASERAAAFYRTVGRDRVADLYLAAAVEAYDRWGASAKARALREASAALGGSTRPPGHPGLVAPEALNLLSLLRAAETISGEVRLDRLLSKLMEVCLAAAGAQRGAFLLEEEDGPHVRALAVVGAPAVLQRTALETTREVPRTVIHHVRRGGEPLVLADAFHHAGPGAFADDGYVADNAVRSVLALPISHQAQRVGILYLENNLATGVFTPDRVQVLQLLSSQMAVSLRNSLLFSALTHEIEDRKRAEAAVRFVAQASEALGESLDHDATLSRVTELAVPGLADWCTVDLVENGEVRRMAAVHKDPEKNLLLAEMRAASEPVVSLPTRHALESGTSLLFPEVTPAVMQRYAANPEALRLGQAIGICSVMVVPLRARGRALGAICFHSGEPSRRYDLKDLELAEELARRAAVAIDNARLYREAQEAVRVRDEFLSVASHELNTPMASLALSLGGLAGMPDGNPLDRGSFLLRPEEIELASLVREAVGRFQPEIERARCPLELAIEGPIHGRWDPVRIEQVLLNLLSNATKFAAGAKIEIRLARRGDQAELSVRDEGIGIDPGRQGRIFDRFERGASSKHYGGLGLGLYICRRIAESHGGSIAVRSEPSRGATFVVTLPCSATDSRPG